MRFAEVNPISHFSSNTSGETPFHIVDEIELIFTFSSNDDVKASILKLGLGVGVVVVVQSFMHSVCAVGVFVFGQSFIHSGLGVGCLSLALGEGEL